MKVILLRVNIAQPPGFYVIIFEARSVPKRARHSHKCRALFIEGKFVPESTERNNPAATNKFKKGE